MKSPLLAYTRRSAIGLVACTTVFVLSAFSADANTGHADAMKTLANLRESWVEDLRTKQLETILKFYTPDAAFLQPTGERITGSAAIRTLFQNVMAAFNSNLTLRSRALEVSGDLAYDSGDYEENLTANATGAKIALTGSYMIVYKKQTDGSWQIVQQVFTGVPPPGT